MRRIRFLLVAAVLASAGSVSAQSVRASAKASAAAKSTPAPAARSTKPVAPIAKSDGKSDAKAKKVDAKATKAAKQTDTKDAAAKLDASEADAPITMSQGEAPDADAPTFVQTEEAIVMSDVGLSDQVRVKIPDKVSAQELLMQYQRVGRALRQLRDQRSEMIMAQIKAVAITCDDIEKSFKLISIHEAAKTPESRISTSVLLMQINAKIDRMRGMTLTKDCLNNPLAKECL